MDKLKIGDLIEESFLVIFGVYFNQLPFPGNIR
jgi:hypothetical protein